MNKNSLPPFVQKLLQPEIYPHPAEKVELIQTHISFVTIAGDSVYKWKKPVDFGFLDFSTLEKRKHFCHRELELNQRLCPELYLEVVTITRNGDQFELNGQGEVVEYGIKMNRMDESGMMSKRIAAGTLTTAELDRLVDVLVPFYENAAQDDAIDEFGKAENFQVNVVENFEQTEGFIGKGGLTRELFDFVKGYSMDFLARTEVFQKRIEEKKIRDCHGDLYSANICFDGDMTYVFDCIEFNERFRYSDVAADIGFLAMDLDFHGLDDLSHYFVKKYQDVSGDAGIRDVLNFYKVYRAYVRAKIALFTASDPAVDKAVVEKCLADSATYFQLAKRYAEGA